MEAFGARDKATGDRGAANAGTKPGTRVADGFRQRLRYRAAQSQLRGTVAWDLDAAGIEPGRLIIEVLESVAADARDDAIMATLAALRSQGISLDLDDFGVGQASLLSIRRFGVRRIKIDRSFVIGIDRRPEQQAMVGGIVSLGRSMGLEALAEGVETPEEEAALTRAGLQPIMQGFGIGKPMPIDDTFAWLETRGRSDGATTRARADVRNRRLATDIGIARASQGAFH
jgi:EAL domain-containing protein (putative c-di-GMP-specific phosphodiesterase class I)